MPIVIIHEGLTQEQYEEVVGYASPARRVILGIKF